MADRQQTPRPESAGTEASKVQTEGSARVLNEVKGRLERMATGEMPVIERIGPDGRTHRVDQTGEMIRPDPGATASLQDRAEAFAAAHQGDPATPPGAAPEAEPAPEPRVEPAAGFWARIKAWFRRG